MMKDVRCKVIYYEKSVKGQVVLIVRQVWLTACRPASNSSPASVMAAAAVATCPLPGVVSMHHRST